MIRVLLFFYCCLLNDRKTYEFIVIKKILFSNKYPKDGNLNTRNFIYKCLDFYRKRKSFSDAQKTILFRVLNG